MSAKPIQPSSIQYVDNGEVNAGDNGVAIVGEGRAIAAEYGAAITGWGNAIAGQYGVASIRGTSLNYANATQCSVAIAWTLGNATVGVGGVAVAGLEPTDPEPGEAPSPSAFAGDGGIAIAGAGGKAQAGQQGVIIIRDTNGVPHAGQIGQNGLEAGQLYRWDETQGFVKA